VKYVALITGWVGRLDGSSVMLVDGEEVPETDPLVHERPDLVVEVVDVPPVEVEVHHRPRGRKPAR
jgi:hypothetical protein